jgi:hypothetical protein
MTSRLQQTINDYRSRLAQHEHTAEAILNAAIKPALDRLYEQITAIRSVLYGTEIQGQD